MRLAVIAAALLLLAAISFLAGFAAGFVYEHDRHTQPQEAAP